MDSQIDQTPRWAKTLQGRDRRPVTPQVGLWDRLDAEWKARQAVNAGAAAAGAMACLNLLTVWMRGSGNPPAPPGLISNIGLSSTFVGLVVALTLGLLAAHLARTRSVVAAWAVLLWAAMEVTLIAGQLYGHVGMRRVSPFILLLAVLGVRGAMKLRQLETKHIQT